MTARRSPAARSTVRCIAWLGRSSITCLIDRHVVPIWITKHERAHAGTVVRVGGLLNPRVQGLRTAPRFVETVDYEPEQKAIANATISRIRERRPVVIAMGARRTPSVQAEQDRTVPVENLIEDGSSRVVLLSVQ